MFLAVRKKTVNFPLTSNMQFEPNQTTYTQTIKISSLQDINKIILKNNNTKRYTRTASKRYSEIKDYGKGSPRGNGHNVKHINSYIM